MRQVHALRVALLLGIILGGCALAGPGCGSELSQSDQELVKKQQEDAIKGSDAAYEKLDAATRKRR